jgi:cytochrome c-type biogenesis protein CcmH/NrfG
MLGIVYYEQGRFGLARQQFTNAMVLRPDDPVLLKYLEASAQRMK